MTRNEQDAWRSLWLISAYNEATASMPGAPLDLQSWLSKHRQRWPEEFAYEDWSTYRPAIRKARLVKAGEE